MFTNQLKMTSTLPAMAVRGIVPLPNNEIKLEVGRPESLLALEKAREHKNHIVLLFFNDTTDENANPNNVFPIGVVAKLIYDMPVLKTTHKVKLEGIVRCQIDEFLQVEPYMEVSFTTLPAESENLDEELAAVRLLIDELRVDNKQMFKDNRELINTISKGVTADKLSDLLAFNLPIDIGSKLKYLETPSINQRLKYTLEDVKKEKYLIDLEQDIEREVRKTINESQKEYYLREKMRVIQDELGDKARKETEIEQLRKKILEAGMPETMEEKALNELNRYNSLGQASGEAGIIKTYLDFVVSLPWNKQSKDNTNIRKAREQLDADHYGLEIVKERILEYLAVRIMTEKNPQAILCLVGPPGVGKTSLARSIADALGKEFVKQSLGGVKDESEIRGHRRTYLGALPGRILQGMKRAGVNNPVFLLDEIDKLSSDFRGDPASALLEVLDAEQNKFFSDHYLEEPYDLSNVFFIATANYLENIPPALRDRLEIVELSSYTEFEKFEIAKRHLISKQLRLHGLSESDFHLSDEALWIIIRDYTKEAGVRELERLIGSLIRKGIKSILMEDTKKVIITAENLSDWLGVAKYSYNKVETTNQIGVVTGLAYTQYGGDTLPVEVTYYPGKGRLVLTGKLGDVMQESAQAALSYVKANSENLGIDHKLFETNDIHIHVPEGAVPKDGPSAGVTIATAIISAFTQRFVDSTVGMTGEITLRGRVLKIGGVREKAIAAHRSGLEKIIIPKDNLSDLEQIPENVRDSLEIISVETINDVIKTALL